MTGQFGFPKYSRRFGLMAAVLGGAVLGAWPMAALANVTPPTLLTAANYSVIGGSGITSAAGTGPGGTGTIVAGRMAIDPGTIAAVTGFPPGVSGSIDANGGSGMANAIQAQADLGAAYTEAANATPFTSLTGTDLGGLVLTPGVYNFSSGAQLTGTLTLNGEGETNPTFIFQVGSGLTTASASSVVLINGASGCAVYWQVGSLATLGSTTSFQGNLMALSGITMDPGSTIGVGAGVNGGRALVRTGGPVTMAGDNLVDEPPASCVFAAATTSTPTTATPTTATPTTGAFGVTPYGLPLLDIALALFTVGVLATSSGLWLRRHRA
jgi:hypothetical protein